MRETAYTTLGRNALSTGLISHFAALIAAMLAAPGGRFFFWAAYGFACLALVLGAYAEMKERGYNPFRSIVFYASAAVSVLPAVGPVATLLILYAAQGKRKAEPFTIGGMLASIPRLKVNPLVLFFFLTILFILFTLSITRHDPYFKREDSRHMKTGVSPDKTPSLGFPMVTCFLPYSAHKGDELVSRGRDKVRDRFTAPSCHRKCQQLSYSIVPICNRIPVRNRG